MRRCYRACRKRLAGGRRVRRGNAVLETALVLPILLALSFGLVEFGYFFYVKHNFQGAAREGARVAITPSATNTDVTSAIQAALTPAGLHDCGYTVTLNPADVSAVATGSNITVTVSCAWGTVGSGFRPLALIGASKNVSGVAVMRKEGS
mgnify:CR=1 FL=1